MGVLIAFYRNFTSYNFYLLIFQIVNGYFVHFFAPKNILRLPKNIVFIIDVSISMRGRKLEQVTPYFKVSFKDN